MTTNHDKLEKAVTEPLIRIEHLDFAYDHERTFFGRHQPHARPGRVGARHPGTQARGSRRCSPSVSVIPKSCGRLDPRDGPGGGVGTRTSRTRRHRTGGRDAHAGSGIAVLRALVGGSHLRASAPAGWRSGDAERRARTAAARMGGRIGMDAGHPRVVRGQKQLTGMAGLLALGPKVVLLDEPTANPGRSRPPAPRARPSKK